MKRLFAGAIAGLLLILALAGCGSGGNDKQGDASPSGTPDAATPSGNGAEASAAESPAQPLKFSLSFSGFDNPYISKVGNLNEDKYVQEINKRANVELDLKVKSHKNYAQQMQLMFASGDIPDVIWSYGDSNGADIREAVASGVFMQLDDLIEQHKAELPNLMRAIPEQAWEQEKVDGKLYGVPTTYLSNGLNEALYIRKDLLDKYKLSVPTTLDEAVQVLTVFKENGMKYPYVGREKWGYTTTFFNPFGISTGRWSEMGGELVPDIIKPEMKEAIAYNRKLREQGLMNPESLTTSGTDWTNKINVGEVGMFTHVPNSFGGWNVGLQAHVPDGEFILIPALKGPDGKAGGAVSPLIAGSVYINKNFGNPLGVLKFLDWQASEEAQQFMNYGYEGKEKYVTPTDPEKLNEMNFLSSLNLVKDNSYNKYTIDLDPNGKEMRNFHENIAPKEGYHAYKVSDLEAFKKYPDLKSNALFYEYAAKIFLGQLPVDAFDDFVKEYRKNGGDEAIKEATELFKQGKFTQY